MRLMAIELVLEPHFKGCWLPLIGHIYRVKKNLYLASPHTEEHRIRLSSEWDWFTQTNE